MPAETFKIAPFMMLDNFSFEIDFRAWLWKKNFAWSNVSMNDVIHSQNAILIEDLVGDKKLFLLCIGQVGQLPVL